MAQKHIMRHSKGRLDLKLCLRGKDIVLKIFYNMDETEDANDRRSIMEYVLFVGVGNILWKCKKQQIIY